MADVKQDMLETIVPKTEYDSIMVVLGEHRGQVSRGSSFLQDVCVYVCVFVQICNRSVDICSGRPYSPAGQEQVQSDGSARPI